MQNDAEVIAAWLHDRPKSTIESYQIDTRQFFRVVDKSLKDITLEDIQRFSTELQQRNLRESSRKRKLNAIKSLFTFAANQQYIPFNVAAAIRLPRTNESVAGRTLKKDDVMRLINSAATEQDHLFLLLMYAIGARVSETIAVTWDDFTEQGSGKIQITIRGKGDKVRSVLVPDSVWQQLQILRSDRDKLFNLTRQQAHILIKQAVKNAGLNPKISCHFLRHSHCRHALDGGAKIQIVRDSMGHSSLQVTDRYLQSFPDESSSDFLGL
jgi:integrase/recombinase XerD